MTLEDMIMDIDSAIEGDGIPEKCGQAIIAALRAGQQMREQVTLDDDDFIDEIDMSMFLEGLRAWDMATKEDI
jgi:hypothetical protein